MRSMNDVCISHDLKIEMLFDGCIACLEKKKKREEREESWSREVYVSYSAVTFLVMFFRMKL